MKNPAIVALAAALSAAAWFGTHAAIRRRRRREVSEFLETVRSGDVLVRSSTPRLEGGKRSCTIIGTAGLHDFHFFMCTDAKGVRRRYYLGWKNAIAEVWNPLKNDRPLGLHEAYEALIKIEARASTSD